MAFSCVTGSALHSRRSSIGLCFICYLVPAENQISLGRLVGKPIFDVLVIFVTRKCKALSKSLY